MHKSLKRFLCGIRITKFVFLFFVFWLSANKNAPAQNFWQQTNGPSGGTIQAFAINSSGQIFAGTQSGGVFRSVQSLAVNAASTIDFGMPIVVSAALSDTVKVREVKLFYREGGKTSFSSTLMNPLLGAVYQATIPSAVVGTRGVEILHYSQRRKR